MYIYIHYIIYIIYNIYIIYIYNICIYIHIINQNFKFQTLSAQLEQCSKCTASVQVGAMA